MDLSQASADVQFLDAPQQSHEESLSYDLVVEGTSLTASIVACAASRSGKTVLHLDRNDFYGSNSASFPLDEFLSWCRASKTKNDQVSSARRANEGTSEKPIFLAADSFLMQLIHFEDSITDTSLSRKFTIDLTSKLVYCSGDAVSCMVNSGVCNYVEFRSMDKIYYCPENGLIYPVPCSKNEVFKDRLLSPVEKRNLTRFLQFNLDWGRVNLACKKVDTFNEMALANGGSLHRPQNKSFVQTPAAASTSDSSSSSTLNSSSLQRLENEPFASLMKSYSLSPKLMNIITHALCLYGRDIGETNKSKDTLIAYEGMVLLYKHINALGIFGTTALIHPLYGTGELPQAFCRMSAVWGGVYMLRQTILSLHISPAAVSAKKSDLDVGGSGEVCNDSIRVQRSEIHDNADMKIVVHDDTVKESNYSDTFEVLEGETEMEDGVYTGNTAETTDENGPPSDPVPLQSEVNPSTPQPQPLPLAPRLLSMTIGASTARPYSTDPTASSETPFSESSSGSTSNSKSRSKLPEEEDREVRCAACLVEASRVQLPFLAVRAGFASRVLVCRIGRREGAGVGELGVAKSRTVIVYPPGSSGIFNRNTIYATLLDHSSCVCPAGYFLMYLSTEITISEKENLNGQDSKGDELGLEEGWRCFVENSSGRVTEEFNGAAATLLKLVSMDLHYPDISPPPPPTSASASSSVSPPIAQAQTDALQPTTQLESNSITETSLSSTADPLSSSSSPPSGSTSVPELGGAPHPVHDASLMNHLSSDTSNLNPPSSHTETASHTDTFETSALPLSPPSSSSSQQLNNTAPLRASATDAPLNPTTAAPSSSSSLPQNPTTATSISSSPPSFSSVTPPSPQSSSTSILPVSSLPPPPPHHPLEVSVITEDPVTVICSATTMRPLYKPTALNNKNQDLRDSNIAVYGETSSSLSCEEEFKQAEEIFKLLYPDLPFLPLRDEEVDHSDPMDEI